MLWTDGAAAAEEDGIHQGWRRPLDTSWGMNYGSALHCIRTHSEKPAFKNENVARCTHYGVYQEATSEKCSVVFS